jgi:hypothetical protein
MIKLKKKIQFYKLFQIKIVIKRTMTKYERKTN